MQKRQFLLQCQSVVCREVMINWAKCLTNETSHTEPPGDRDAIKVGERASLEEDRRPHPSRRDADRHPASQRVSLREHPRATLRRGHTFQS